MNTVGGQSTNTVPERFRSKAVMVSRKYPPLESLRRAHCSERLSPNPIGRRRGIEEIAGNEHMARAVIPRRNRQAVDRSMAGLHKTSANVAGKVPESAAQVQVRGMDKAKLGHSSRTPKRVAGNGPVSDPSGPKVSAYATWRPPQLS